MYKERKGEKFKTNQGYEITIIEDLSSVHKLIEFNDKHKTRLVREYGHIKKGSIKNPYHPTVCGVGYLGSLNTPFNEKKRVYSIWTAMIGKCYNPSDTHYKWYGQKGVTVCERWHCFANFFNDFMKLEGYDEWCTSQEVYHLDKDIKQYGKEMSEKVYSPDTCLLVPARINVREMTQRNYS